MSTALSDTQLSQFEHDGFLAVRGLFDPSEIDAIRATFMDTAKHGPVPGLSDVPKAREGAPANSSDPLAFYPRMMHPHKHPDKPVGPLAMRYMRDARLRPILAELLGEEPLACQSMFYFKPPGARGQDLHQDNFYLRVKPGTCMAAWLAIDDADEEAHMALIRLQAQCGRRTAAIAQYEACRAALLDRLGARPSAECFALYRRIHADAPAADAPAADAPAPVAEATQALAAQAPPVAMSSADVPQPAAIGPASAPVAASA